MAAVATGAILLVFEILELFMVPFHPVMHPLLLIGSAGIMGIAYTPSARRHLKSAGRTPCMVAVFRPWQGPPLGLTMTGKGEDHAIRHEKP